MCLFFVCSCLNSVSSSLVDAASLPAMTPQQLSSSFHSTITTSPASSSSSSGTLSTLASPAGPVALSSAPPSLTGASGVVGAAGGGGGHGSTPIILSSPLRPRNLHSSTLSSMSMMNGFIMSSPFARASKGLNLVTIDSWMIICFHFAS